jgi:extracellular factor (EF) 3-hydroxypalmitic acid methyl ester biosynthesis protein
MATQNASQAGSGDTFVSFQTNQGHELNGTVLKVGRFQVAFELYTSSSVLRTSEALNTFKIIVQDRPVYSGKAVISNLIDLGNFIVCEVRLEDAWLDLNGILPQLDGKALSAGCREFLVQWQRVYKILPEYKATISDMQMFLSDLRLWLDQVELAIRATPNGERVQLEHDLAQELGQVTTSALGALFERFESVAERVEKDLPDQRGGHSAFAKRLLHPLLLCSPFLYRTFHKPLGYAGDYEMVNMICRDPLEGSTLFAKIVNLWFLRQPPAEAHRNRIQYLVDRLSEVTLRRTQNESRVRILSVGCGPAREVQRFMAENLLADRADFTLIDFDQETVDYTLATLARLKRQYSRSTNVEVIRKSVGQILKDAGKTINRPGAEQYDFVYCAGLFDYLPDPLCRRLSNVLYSWVAPGGLFVATNVDMANPRRLTMNYIMDWHLLYRNSAQMASLRPDSINGADDQIVSDPTGVNLHYAVRKPQSD